MYVIVYPPSAYTSFLSGKVFFVFFSFLLLYILWVWTMTRIVTCVHHHKIPRAPPVHPSLTSGPWSSVIVLLSP